MPASGMGEILHSLLTHSAGIESFGARVGGRVQFSAAKEGLREMPERLYYTLKCPGLVHVLFCHKKKSKHGIGIPEH